MTCVQLECNRSSVTFFIILFDLLVLYLSSENASAICSWRCWNIQKEATLYICIWKAELQRKLCSVCSVCNVHTISCKHLITYVAIIVNVVTSTAPYTSSLPTTTLIMLLTCTCMFVGSIFCCSFCVYVWYCCVFGRPLSNGKHPQIVNEKMFKFQQRDIYYFLGIVHIQFVRIHTLTTLAWFYKFRGNNEQIENRNVSFLLSPNIGLQFHSKAYGIREIFQPSWLFFSIFFGKNQPIVVLFGSAVDILPLAKHQKSSWNVRKSNRNE